MTIKFRHYREMDEHGKVSSRGGATLAFMQDGANRFVGSVAYCSPKDNYNKSYGRAKAGGKLLQRNKDDTTSLGSIRHFNSMADTAKEFIDEMDTYMALNEGYSPR